MPSTHNTSSTLIYSSDFANCVGKLQTGCALPGHGVEVKTRHWSVVGKDSITWVSLCSAEPCNRYFSHWQSNAVALPTRMVPPVPNLQGLEGSTTGLLLSQLSSAGLLLSQLSSVAFLSEFCSSGFLWTPSQKPSKAMKRQPQTLGGLSSPQMTSMVEMTKRGPWLWQASPSQPRHNHPQHQGPTWIPQPRSTIVFRLLNHNYIKSSRKLKPQQFHVQGASWSWFLSQCNHYS